MTKPTANPNPGHILIVDDTQKNIQVLGSILRQEGYAINVATNGRQALESLARIHPDLILLDVMMPEMDGFETCRHLKEDPSTADIPVIFLTAKVETADLVRGFELGAVDYVTKPFNATELLRRVETHLMVARLRRELQGRVDSLQQALEEIERMQREQDAFLRHEVNNAVGPISGYAYLLEEQAGAALSDQQKDWLSRIRTGTTSIQSLLEDMRRLQTFERQDVALDRRPVDLGEVLGDVVRDLVSARRREQSRPVEVQVDMPDDAVRVQADPSFLPGVFTNLVKNAMEHVDGEGTGDGEGSARVRVQLSVEDGYAVVRVRNGGAPVSAECLPTFFDKFNSTKSDRGGTGLGTSYAALVTRAHGGRIEVASNATDGTTVTVRLPL
ncbi:MAG: hybrid sensor histidine kinase/response regulator [Rhodothermales bacterium]